MEKDQYHICNILLNKDEPTEVAQKALFRWVVWQMPDKSQKGNCGAVCSPDASRGWLPALIYPQNGQVLVYGHLDQHFESPEDATSYFKA